MLGDKDSQLSIYAILYNKIPKNHILKLIEKVEKIVEQDETPLTAQVLENAKEILNDPKFIEQRGTRSIVDQEARVGHKSRNEHFFGYKTEFIMTTSERIITAVTVENGAYMDGTNFNKLPELTRSTGLAVEEIYGDKAYFRKPILDKIQEIKAKAYIPVSEVIYRIDEEKFSYNKDSDEWFCRNGNSTGKKTLMKKTNGYQTYAYYFQRDICQHCPLKSECVSEKTKAKVLRIGINAIEFYGYSQEQKSPEFKEKYKNRASHEGKNGEMKNHHGLGRARGYGLRSMANQAKLTAIAVNLKRIAAILSSDFNSFSDFILNILEFRLIFRKNPIFG